MLKNTKTFSGFAVRDIEKTREFYGDTLGLDITKTAYGLDMYVGDGRTIFIYEEASQEPGSYTMLYFVVSNVEHTVDELTKRGVKFEVYNTADIKTDNKGIMRSMGPMIAWFKDPSGNFLAVTEEVQKEKMWADVWI